MCSVVDKFLKMPLDEKRKRYRSSTFYTVDKISTWQDYFLKSKERLKMQCKLFMYILLSLLLYVFCKCYTDPYVFCKCYTDPYVFCKCYTDPHVKVNWYQILN
jgi:hypothetical protein